MTCSIFSRWLFDSGSPCAIQLTPEADREAGKTHLFRKETEAKLGVQEGRGRLRRGVDSRRERFARAISESG
jgi:hypothetical protein